MTKKLTTIALALLTITFISLLSACSGVSVPNENKIKEDLENRIDYYIGLEVIDKVEIVKRKTDDEAKEDMVWCQVESNDSKASYIRNFIIMYALYDEGGWQFEEFHGDQKENWSSTPLAGVDSKTINTSLSGFSINIDDEEWAIDSNTIDSFTISKQETQLEQKKDIVVVAMIINDDVLTAQGELEFVFKYEDGWKLSDYRVFKPFETSAKAHTKLEISDDILINAIAKKPMILGEGKTEQLINIELTEISEFSLIDSVSENKDTTQIYNCSFKLDKKLVDLNVNAQVVYQYDKVNGWNISDISCQPSISSVNIEGEWIGEYAVYSGDVKLNLNISQVADDGSMTATFNFSAAPTNPSYESGSYKAIGGVDFNTLRVVIEGVEWIEQPPGLPYSWFINLDGCLRIDSSVIKAISGTAFEVKKAQ